MTVSNHSASPETNATTPTDRTVPTETGSALRRALLGAGVLLGAAAITALIMTTGPDGSPEEQTEKAWPVTVVNAAPSDMHPMFATYGRVEARTEAKLRTDIQAPVEQVYVQAGEWAREGDVLIQLRADEIQLRMQEAKAEAEQAQAALKSVRVEQRLMQNSSGHFEKMYRISQQKLARQQELAQKHMIPQALLDSAIQQASRDTIEYQNHQRTMADLPNQITQRKAALTIAQARAARAQLDLDKTKVLAPFTGPVLEVAVSPGDRTSAETILVTMADAASFEVRASIPNLYADRVRHALTNNHTITANVATDSHSSTSAPETQLHLSRVAHNVRRGQSGLDAWFRFPPAHVNAQRLPALGRVINLSALLPSEPGLVALPAQAIYENDRVYLVTNNRLQAISVERIGEFKSLTGVEQVLVRGDNLQTGATIMITTLPKAITGLLVEPIRATEIEESAIANGETSVRPQKQKPAQTSA